MPKTQMFQRVLLLGAAALGDLPRFAREETMCLGEDVLEVYRTPT